MRQSLLVLAALLLTATAPAPRIADLAWLAGAWSSQTGTGWTEERWAPPRGGAMLGTSRSGDGERMREFEFLRIQPDQDGTLAYFAQPGGAPAVAFRLVQSDRTSATFENPAHDFPQRIRYVRSGQILTATISAIDGSNAISWTLRRSRH